MKGLKSWFHGSGTAPSELSTSPSGQPVGALGQKADLHTIEVERRGRGRLIIEFALPLSAGLFALLTGGLMQVYSIFYAELGLRPDSVGITLANVIGPSLIATVVIMVPTAVVAGATVFVSLRAKQAPEDSVIRGLQFRVGIGVAVVLLIVVALSSYYANRMLGILFVVTSAAFFSVTFESRRWLNIRAFSAAIVATGAVWLLTVLPLTNRGPAPGTALAVAAFMLAYAAFFPMAAGRPLLAAYLTVLLFPLLAAGLLAAPFSGTAAHAELVTNLLSLFLISALLGTLLTGGSQVVGGVPRYIWQMILALVTAAAVTLASVGIASVFVDAQEAGKRSFDAGVAPSAVFLDQVIMRPGLVYIKSSDDPMRLCVGGVQVFLLTSPTRDALILRIGPDGSWVGNPGNSYIVVASDSPSCANQSARQRGAGR